MLHGFMNFYNVTLGYTLKIQKRVLYMFCIYGTSIRLDADVLAWFKVKIIYQTRMNKILRDAMLKELNNHR